jgi:hypothetical protein
MIIASVPSRILKLQFKQTETQLRNEYRLANAEIAEEYSMLDNKNQIEIDHVFKRHELKFRQNDFHSMCESHLESLRVILSSDDSKDDRKNMENVYEELQTEWFKLNQQIDILYTKLTMLPNANENFEKNLHELSVWLDLFQENSQNLFNNDVNCSTEYKNILENTKVNEFIKSKHNHILIK